eukprot:UN03969
MEHHLCLSVDVTCKPAINETFTISIHTSAGNFEIVRTAKELHKFHQKITKDKRFRGINLPTFPSNSRHRNADSHYNNYLKEILHRVVLIKETILFLNPPNNIKQKMIELYDELNQPSKLGEIKKKGDKFKAFRNRYFALYPNYTLEYYQNEIAYLTPQCKPKGCIDLTLVRMVLIHEDPKHPNSMKLITNKRDWILQCSSDTDRK